MKANEEALTAERLRELLSYDQETGEFRWSLGGKGTGGPGSVAGHVSRGYVRICVAGHMYQAHRLAWLYVHGEWPVDQIDHINGEKIDNHIANLREATASENGGNQRKAASNNKAGLLGVSWYKQRKKFKAQIKLNGKTKHLGMFSTSEQAHQAYLVAKRELHPFCTI